MEVRELKRHYAQLVFQKAIYELVAEARRGYLGIIWWVMEPVLYLGVFYILFVVLFRRGGDDAVNFLLAGLVVWKWFASSILQCSNSIGINNGLIWQINIPKILFPIISIVNNTIKFGIIFAIFVVYLLVTGVEPSAVWFLLPIVLIAQFLLISGLSLLVSAIVPFVPDLRFLIDNGMMLLFFLSGIFFDVSSVSSDLKIYLYFNPMLGLIEAYRDILLNNQLPDFQVISLTILFSTLLIGIALSIFRKFDRVYAKII
ncbi:ABC transporter permease [Candidatus Parcubacteria bacterium]|nr:MAG: ABC transporter permease [Candidatus Parcubacteria bacterium]